MSDTQIAEDGRPLGQLFWFLMFLGWTPMLAAYGHVLDPITSARNGIIVTFADSITLYQQAGWYGPAVGVLTVASLFSVAALLRLGWHALWPIPLFLLWSCLIFVFNPPGLGTVPELPAHVVYSLLAFSSAYLFLRHGHLLSAGFLGYVALLLVDVALHYTVFPGGILGGVFEFYTPSLVTALQFFFVAILLRMVWLMVRDNRDFYRSLKPADRKRAAAQTFKFWWPMLAVFAAANCFWWALANYWVQPAMIAEFDRSTVELEQKMGPLLAADLEINRNLFSPDDFEALQVLTMIENAIRRMEANDWVAEQLKDHRQKSHAFYEAWKAEAHVSEEALERSVRRWVQLKVGVSNISIQLGIIDAGYEVKQKGGSFPAAAEQQIRSAFPRSALPTLFVRKCWFWQFSCLAEAEIATRLNLLMDSLHSGMIGTVTGQLDRINTEAQGQVDLATQNARDYSQILHERFSRDTTTAIRDTFRIWRNISLLALAYSSIILIKTLIIVFSRVIFSPKSGIGASAKFLPHQEPQDSPGISRHGAVYRIPTSAPEAYFVSRWGVTLEGPPPARRSPLGFRFPVARILSGNWAMNRIEGNRADEAYEFDADLKVDEPAEIVVWQLAPGERVVFRFSDFIGMSEGVQIRRISTLSITTLVLGRMIFHAADGPGAIILRTTAAARISTDEDGSRPAPMPKLVAWGAETRFGVLAALTTVDTFLSGYNLKVAEGDRVIWDTSTKRGDGPGQGILRFIRSFLLPL